MDEVICCFVLDIETLHVLRIIRIVGISPRSVGLKAVDIVCRENDWRRIQFWGKYSLLVFSPSKGFSRDTVGVFMHDYSDFRKDYYDSYI